MNTVTKSEKIVSHETFVKGYMQAVHDRTSKSELARQLGLTYGTVDYRIRALKNVGVALPDLPRVRPNRPDVQRLNNIIRNFKSS